MYFNIVCLQLNREVIIEKPGINFVTAHAWGIGMTKTHCNTTMIGWKKIAVVAVSWLLAVTTVIGWNTGKLAADKSWTSVGNFVFDPSWARSHMLGRWEGASWWPIGPRCIGSTGETGRPIDASAMPAGLQALCWRTLYSLLIIVCEDKVVHCRERKLMVSRLWWFRQTDGDSDQTPTNSMVKTPWPYWRAADGRFQIRQGINDLCIELLNYDLEFGRTVWAASEKWWRVDWVIFEPVKDRSFTAYVLDGRTLSQRQAIQLGRWLSSAELCCFYSARLKRSSSNKRCCQCLTEERRADEPNFSCNGMKYDNWQERWSRSIWCRSVAMICLTAMTTGRGRMICPWFRTIFPRNSISTRDGRMCASGGELLRWIAAPMTYDRLRRRLLLWLVQFAWAVMAHV